MLMIIGMIPIVFYSDYYDMMIANDYTDYNGVYCEYSVSVYNEWRRDGDYVQTTNGETATTEYAEDNWHYSHFSNEWCIDVVYSEYHETYINYDSSIAVFFKCRRN